MLKLIFTFALLLTGSAQSANLCPGFESDVITCDVMSQYATLKARAKKVAIKRGLKALDLSKIKDLMARRFINRPDWEKYLQKDPSVVDPRCVYDPKPQTWENWYSVTLNEVEVQANSQDDLSIAMISSWNKNALVNTVSPFLKTGEPKATQNYGQNLEANWSLSAKDIAAVTSTEFKTVRGAHLEWTPLQCKETVQPSIDWSRATPECSEIYSYSVKNQNEPFWKQTYNDFMKLDLRKSTPWFWYACWPRAKASEFVNGRQCGMIKYLDPKLVSQELNLVLDNVNKYLKSPQKRTDPLTFAMQTQRQIVGIHPFNKGNGRVSRWVEDFILTRLGLPPVLYLNMDSDLNISPIDVTAHAYMGAVDGLSILNECMKEYESQKTLKEIQAGKCGLVSEQMLVTPGC